MARFLFLLAIWILAITLGILGYQALTWYFYQSWPQVSVGFSWQEVRSSWQEMFGDFWLIPVHYRFRIPPGEFQDALDWLGEMPLVPVGMIVSYTLFLLSDALRGRLARRA